MDRFKGTYWKLIISFTCILIFSVISELFIHFYSYRNFESAIAYSNSMALKQVSSLFDSIVQEANTLFSQIVLNRNISSAVKRDANGIIVDQSTIYRIRQSLELMKTANTQDLLVYFKNSNRVVSSTNTAFILPEYYNAYYKTDNFDYETFSRFFPEYNFTTITSFGGMYDLAIFQSFPTNRLRDSNAVLMYKLNRTTMVNMLNRIKWREGAAMIFNRNNELVASSNGNCGLIDLSEFSKDSACYNRKENGNEYIIQFVTSSYTGCKFVSVVPVNLFWEKLNRMHMFSIYTICASTAVGIVMSLLLSRHNYRPILTLVRDISEKSRISPTTGNELDYIRNIMDTTLNKQDKYMETYRDEFLIRILKGIYSERKNIFQEFESVGIQLLSNRFIVMILRIDTRAQPFSSDPCPNHYIDYVGGAIKDILAELCANQHQVFVVCDSRITYTCILNLSNNFKVNIQEICRNMLDKLKSERKIICTASIGSEYSDWEGLEKSAGEAAEAMQYHSVFGTGSILCFSRMERGDFNYNFDFRNSAEMLILLTIINGEPSPEEVLRQIKEKRCSGRIRIPEEYKCYFYDMNDLLRKVVDQMTLNTEVLNDLLICENLPQFDEKLIETLSKLHNLYLIRNKQNADDVRMKEMCDQILDYIKQNYTDPNISVDSVARVFNLTSPYLSRKFKSFTGISISDCITNMRINRIMHLLIHTDDSINSIKEAVGFLSSTVMIRVFKRINGITPGSYRKLYKK